MSYEVKPDGSIVVPTLEEAIAVQQRIQASQGKQGANSGNPPRAPRKLRKTNKGLQFLEVVAQAGKGGIGSTQLAERIGLDNPKGLSFHVKAATRILEEKGGGKPVHSFLWKERGRDGAKWYANLDRLKEIGLMNGAP